VRLARRIQVDAAIRKGYGRSPELHAVQRSARRPPAASDAPAGLQRGVGDPGQLATRRPRSTISCVPGAGPTAGSAARRRPAPTTDPGTCASRLSTAAPGSASVDRSRHRGPKRKHPPPLRQPRPGVVHEVDGPCVGLGCGCVAHSRPRGTSCLLRSGKAEYRSLNMSADNCSGRTRRGLVRCQLERELTVTTVSARVGHPCLASGSC
jgi:hypothetical protein